MNICVFDTETTNLEKPFCYNIGYVIYDTLQGGIIVKKDFIVEQVWHNPMLFSTAYYVDKRPIYVSAMKGKKATMDKFGYICQEMIRDFKVYSVQYAYAYNASFDEKVFDFNCNWFKCNNPFDTVKIYDIRPYVINHLVDQLYCDFCEDNGCFTEAMNYSTTAETAYKYIINDPSFVEEHTALADAIIELRILIFIATQYMIDITIEETAPNSIPRTVVKTFTLVDPSGNVYTQQCNVIKISKDKTKVTLA